MKNKGKPSLRSTLFIFREVFELFNEACSAALQCGPELAVDETLYANRGRGLAFKQFLPQKPRKYGFLFKSLGDSVHAYIYRSHIYAGRPTKEPTDHYIQGRYLQLLRLCRYIPYLPSRLSTLSYLHTVYLHLRISIYSKLIYLSSKWRLRYHEIC